MGSVYHSSALQPTTLFGEISLNQPRLCVGIDIGKLSHVAGFVSATLLGKHGRFHFCPTLSFKNSRTGFDGLLTAMQQHAALSDCIVLIENTGHYGRALEYFLQSRGVALHKIHV